MEIEAPQAQVSEGLSSSVFEIVSLANIPADKSGHKVIEGDHFRRVLYDLS